MIQYLLNLSCIWLLSLLVFDLILAKERSHVFNRFYLLSTFILGLLLPLWSWQENATTYPTAFIMPVTQRASELKETIATNTITRQIVDMQTILLSIYFLGLLVTFLLVLREVIIVVNCYRKATRFKDGVWTIVETGKQHSPYSAIRYVFISNRTDYTNEQLRMILTHEEQHGHLLHFFDLLLMQLAKITFWFHPLVYMYAERLSIVHEYQADAAVDNSPNEYGQFLIEQAILQSAPTVAHSFNRSPIKKRIMMLTKPKSSISMLKALTMLPLLAICFLCFSKDGLALDKKTQKGDLVYFRGYTVEFKMSDSIPPDTTIVVDPETGEESIRITEVEPGLIPIKLNGDKIYNSRDIEKIAQEGKHYTYKPHLQIDELNMYLLDNLKPELHRLKDGDYYLRISPIILDKNGKIAYYNCDGVLTASYNHNIISPDQQARFIKTLEKALNNSPIYEPAAADKKHVPYIMDEYTWKLFTIKKGTITAIR
ncbi:MAG: hypothetical protein BGO70_13645 [Bacteroidetes bacterium 43-93]|nr:hypothetical protein [Bacteroidota bacterium]OJW99479.1 MAG: hypothetical protein BGO70_13645 [Bacteroidetes bacterium 43-93]